MIRNGFAVIGICVVALYLLGAIGIGNFRVYYGSDLPAQWCAKGQL
ncbi:hypothetical protein [Paraburkholderia sp. BCC1885]|nr:hypothetical protein [Paraburkholderia sp. BCC1885]